MADDARLPPIGLLPAAGRGTRLRPYRAPKELLPVMLRNPASADEILPTPVCMFALRALKRAGADRCVVAISDAKLDVMRTLGDGSDEGVPLAYIHQAEPRGLPDVVLRARLWLEGRDVVFAMPDTIFLPEHALQLLHQRRTEQDADVMLGLFHADEPERLGAVEIDDAGLVIAIHDKPGHRRWPWCWGVLAWSARFTQFCCEWEQKLSAEEPAAERVIGHAMEAARRAGLKVIAHRFADGAFLDVGTPSGLASAMRLLAARGLAFGTAP